MSNHSPCPVPSRSAARLVGALAAAALLVACENGGAKKTDTASAAPAPAQAAAPAHGTPIAKAPTERPVPKTPVAVSDAEPERPSRGAIKVQFGIMPGDYEDTAKGVLVGSVTPGASADAAGIKAGDRLMTWNGQEIVDIGTWMKFMTASKPGDIVDVGVQRDGKLVPVKVTLKARQD